jgi:hypothetical protein
MHCSGDGIIKLALRIPKNFGRNAAIFGGLAVPGTAAAGLGAYSMQQPLINATDTVMNTGTAISNAASGINKSVNQGINLLDDKVQDAVDKTTELVDAAKDTNKNMTNLLGESAGQTAGLTSLSLGGLGAYALYSSAVERRRRDAERKRILGERNLPKKYTGSALAEKLQELDDNFESDSKARFSDYVLPAATLAGSAGLGLLAYNRFKNVPKFTEEPEA